MNTGNTKENINLLKEYEWLKAENERLIKGIEGLINEAKKALKETADMDAPHTKEAAEVFIKHLQTLLTPTK